MQELEKKLSDLPLGAIRCHERLGSTNDVAAQWTQAGAPHLALVIADEQTAGRGRFNRSWITPPGVALAFSLILRSEGLRFDHAAAAQISGLGALAICEALNRILPESTPARIKWPNDVVVSRRKLAGVLAESHWQGDELQAIILGIGINVAPDSVPPQAELQFPATCVEAVLERPVERWDLLHGVLSRILDWLPGLSTQELTLAWERCLAYRGELVVALQGTQLAIEGHITGLNQDGSLRLRTLSGEEKTLQFGEIMLRPVDRMIK